MFSGGPDCLCRELVAKDRPCLMCEARAAKDATPVAPAFQMRQATVWTVVVAFQVATGPDTIHRQMLVMCADPTGAEVAGVALTQLRADMPGAQSPKLLRAELIGEARGTAVVCGGPPA